MHIHSHALTRKCNPLPCIVPRGLLTSDSGQSDVRRRRSLGSDLALSVLEWGDTSRVAGAHTLVSGALLLVSVLVCGNYSCDASCSGVMLWLKG